MLFALVVAAIIGQVAGENPVTTWTPVAASLLGVSGALAIWWRYWRPALENQQGRIDQLEQDRADDRVRIEVLVRCIRTGQDIPAGIWKSPPEVT